MNGLVQDGQVVAVPFGILSHLCVSTERRLGRNDEFCLYCSVVPMIPLCVGVNVSFATFAPDPKDQID